MIVIPLKGMDIVRFGDLNSDIESRLGTPDYVKNPGAKDGVSSEVYIYKTLGLELYFDEDSKFGLWGIITTNRSATLYDVKPIGLTENELLTAFPGIEVEVDDGCYREFYFPQKEISFILINGVVAKLAINPDLDNYIKEFVCN